MSNKSLTIVSVVAVIIAVTGLFFPKLGAAKFGDTNYGSLEASSLTIGSTCNNEFSTTCVGTQVRGINIGSCVIFPYATTIAATSTAVVDCQANAVGALAPLPGVLLNDHVQITLASTTSSLAGGLVLNGASASTTPGYITLRVLNLTGTTFTWNAAATTSISYISTR